MGVRGGVDAKAAPPARRFPVRRTRTAKRMVAGWGDHDMGCETDDALFHDAESDEGSDETHQG